MHPRGYCPLFDEIGCRGAPQLHRNQGGLRGGLQGLAGGVSQGMTGLYRSPIAGYGTGSSSGLAVGLGRGILGAVGLPLSGALDLVSSISAGVAASTGITHNPRLRRPGRLLGKLHPAPFELPTLINRMHPAVCLSSGNSWCDWSL